MSNMLIYCPICGGLQSINSNTCKYCKSVVTMKESLSDKKYYMRISEKYYGNEEHWYDIFFENEIKNLSSLDENKVMEFYEKIKFDDLERRVMSDRFEKLMSCNNNQPKCPTCNSTNIRRISDISRGTHALVFGLCSKTARSQFECRNCGYKW